MPIYLFSSTYIDRFCQQPNLSSNNSSRDFGSLPYQHQRSDSFPTYSTRSSVSSTPLSPEYEVPARSSYQSNANNVGRFSTPIGTFTRQYRGNSVASPDDLHSHRNNLNTTHSIRHKSTALISNVHGGSNIASNNNNNSSSVTSSRPFSMCETTARNRGISHHNIVDSNTGNATMPVDPRRDPWHHSGSMSNNVS